MADWRFDYLFLLCDYAQEMTARRISQLRSEMDSWEMWGLVQRVLTYYTSRESLPHENNGFQSNKEL